MTEAELLRMADDGCPHHHEETPARPPVQLVPSVFTGPGLPGDFAWMIDRPEYADALFVFNDNEDQWDAHRWEEPWGCQRGGGNAVIRPYQCLKPQRAIGIPTGNRGCGYSGLTPAVRAVIDSAVAAVAKLLDTGRYKRLIYSAANASGDLGTGIFSVHPDVRKYIVDSLRRLTCST